MRARIGWRAITRYLAGESTPDEVETIHAWAEADPRHREILDSASRAWLSAEPTATTFDASRAWPELAKRLDTSAPAPFAPGISRRMRGPARYLGYGLLAAAIASVFIVPRLRDNGAASNAEFTTRTAEFRTIQLDDGSVIRLAANSRLRAAPNGGREAWLEGTGFFAIAKRHGQPFIVHTRSGDAQVLGTRFELSSVGRGVRLVVYEGRVALSAKGSREVVEAGQASSVEKGRVPAPPQRVALPPVTDWMKGILIFQTSPLSDVAAEIERQYGATVRLTDQALGSRTISAVFENQSLETVVAAVCRVADATCEVHENTVVMRP